MGFGKIWSKLIISPKQLFNFIKLSENLLVIYAEPLMSNIAVRFVFVWIFKILSDNLWIFDWKDFASWKQSLLPDDNNGIFIEVEEFRLNVWSLSIFGKDWALGYCRESGGL